MVSSCSFVVSATLAMMLSMAFCAHGFDGYERGPGYLEFNTLGCQGSPSNAFQYYSDESLDEGVLTRCENYSSPGFPISRTVRCGGGQMILTSYISTDDCTGIGTFESRTTDICYSWTHEGANFSKVYLCSPDAFGSAQILPLTPPIDTVPPLAGSDPVPCEPLDNCTQGTFYVDVYYTSEGDQPTCEVAKGSYMLFGAAQVGQLYIYDDIYNVKLECTSRGYANAYYPAGPNNPPEYSYGGFFPNDRQCLRADNDIAYHCPIPDPVSPPSSGANQTVPTSLASMDHSIHLPFLALSSLLALLITGF